MEIEGILQVVAAVIMVASLGIGFFIFEKSFICAIGIILASIFLGMIFFALARIINILEEIEENTEQEDS